MEEEIWKEVEGTEGKYIVSNLGRVWNTRYDVEVSQVLTGIPQYKYVNFTYNDGTRGLKRVHRLVAQAFLENLDNLPIVDHIDQDKFNNVVVNLRWVTKEGNQRNMKNNVYISYLGEEVLLVKLCKIIFEKEYLNYYTTIFKLLKEYPAHSFESALYKYCFK